MRIGLDHLATLARCPPGIVDGAEEIGDAVAVAVEHEGLGVHLDAVGLGAQQAVRVVCLSQ